MREDCSNAIEKNNNYVPIIIIGAGISGLTVASNLEKDFLILEARERIGGRVWSRECCDNLCTLDMGAAWIHGSIDNPLNTFLEYNEMIPVSESNPWIHTDKSNIVFEGITSQERQQLIVEWNRVAKELSQMTNTTVADAFAEYNANNREMESFLYLLEVWCGTSVSLMPPSFLRNIECDDSLFGDYAGSHCLFKKGAKSLITSIVESSKTDLEGRILFHQIIRQNVYDRPDGCIQVITESGILYICDKLIISIPPGPLQDIEFIPPLSESRQNALSKIKMGSYKKVQLEFDNVFWNKDASMILTCQKENTYIPYILWNNYANIKGAPVIEAVCPANIGWQLTGKSDEEINDTVLIHLKNLYPWMPDPIS